LLLSVTGSLLLLYPPVAASSRCVDHILRSAGRLILTLF
jgi:hypothetical protein